jgi:hypothetical protein
MPAILKRHAGVKPGIAARHQVRRNQNGRIFGPVFSKAFTLKFCRLFVI